ncbi:MAG: radical SAM protein [Elusimicrobiota bacterium]
MAVFSKIARAAWRAAVPTRLRGEVSDARERVGDLLSYALMRIRPHTLYIEGTNICNARCVFCAYPQMKRSKATMPMETFQRVVEQYLALGHAEVDLTPIVGDPFVDRHLLERLDFLASRAEVKGFHFYTNAILMKPDILERLVAYDGRFTIFCSFGGFDRKTYHRVMGVDKFDEAVANIRGLIDAKELKRSKISIQVNLRAPKGSESGEFWDYLIRREREGLLTVDAVDDFDNWGGDISETTLRQAGLVPKPPPIHRGPCRRLLTGPTVLADGRVNACCCRDIEATLIIGDVHAEPLSDILSGAPIRGLLERHARGDYPKACRDCTRYESIYPAWMQGWVWRLLDHFHG